MGLARSARRFFWSTGLLVLIIMAAVVIWRRAQPDAHAAFAPPAAVPVTTSVVMRRDVPIFLDALGTIQASNTVAIHSQIDGKLQAVNFVEGQNVAIGDTLAVIDPRSLQAALDQAVAKKAQDQAQLIAAQKDLERFKTLVVKDYATQQSVDQQQGKVDQLKASLDADQAAIESAQTQLSYTTIVAPIGGRVGFRQVDAGNIIHANDSAPLTVLTQIRPSTATFTLPQKNLSDVREAMLRGTVSVLAFDQDNTHALATGKLLLIDNEIDQTTSTIRLKAEFANDDERLWPGEFVHLHIQTDTRHDALTVPPVAMQRGPQGLYTWVVKPDGTAEQRVIAATTVSNEIAIATDGLAAGERVVINGQYRLQQGTRVDVKPDAVATKPDKAS
jgi:multidrug efflux system membrane fusion protein